MKFTLAKFTNGQIEIREGESELYPTVGSGFKIYFDEDKCFVTSPVISVRGNSFTTLNSNYIYSIQTKSHEHQP